MVAQARVRGNDALMLDAVLDATAEDGWPGLALTAAARRAGLSQRPVASVRPPSTALPSSGPSRARALSRANRREPASRRQWNMWPGQTKHCWRRSNSSSCPTSTPPWPQMSGRALLPRFTASAPRSATSRHERRRPVALISSSSPLASSPSRDVPAPSRSTSPRNSTPLPRLAGRHQPAVVAEGPPPAPRR